MRVVGSFFILIFTVLGLMVFGAIIAATGGSPWVIGFLVCIALGVIIGIFKIRAESKEKREATHQ